MRKGAVSALAVITVLLIGSTIMFYSKFRRSTEDFAQLKTEDESNRLRYGQAIGEIATIQDSLNAIVLGDGAVQGFAVRSQAEAPLPGTLHDQVLTRIATLRGAIERTKERIQELDTRLKRNGIKIAGLEKMIAGLRKSVADKEDRIAQLTTQVDTLQTQVSGLTVAVEGKQQELLAKQQELATKQQELATIFYTMGSKKELIRAGVVLAQGGVLGLGKTLKPSGHIDEAALTPLDTDQETVIQIPSEKARVLSAQPVSSYVLQPVGKDRIELRIVDPKEFRKVKQVVILKT